jgi:predicted dehydrogenase
VTYLQSQYLYGGEAPCLTSQSGAIAASGLSFEHGYDIYLENATLQFNNLFTNEEIWIYTGGEKRVLQPERPEAFVAQLQHATECVATGRESELISATSARNALAVCLKEQRSVLTGETVTVAD